MAISFSQIPGNIRTPGVYVEVDNSRANSGLAQLNYRILVFGQKLSTGTAPANVPVLVTSRQKAQEFFGRGSLLALMFERLFDNNEYTEKWAVPLEDDDAGIAATGTFAISGTATAAGTINAYIGGKRVRSLVESGDSATTAATNLAAAINADGDLPVTASANTGTVTVTARNKGEVGNDIDLRLNYLGDLGGEKTPAGLTITVTKMADGANNPDIALAISALPDEIYNYWIGPYTDASNLTKIETELVRRFGPLVQLEGHYITAKADTVSNLITLGKSRNNPHVSIMDASNNSPTPAYEWAAAVGGRVAFSASIDPARPFQTLRLINVLPAPAEDRRTQTERNSLLYGGIATHDVTRAGDVLIERVITTYLENAQGAPDSSYLDANRLFTLSYLRQTYIARITQKYPRHKLANDGTVFGAGQAIVTPNVIRAESVAIAGDWALLGLIDSLEQFQEELIVERDLVDRNRINVVLPPTLVGQFRVLAALLQFRV